MLPYTASRFALVGILRACRDSEREVLLRHPANVAVALQDFFPGTTQSLLGLVGHDEMRRRGVIAPAEPVGTGRKRN